MQNPSKQQWSNRKLLTSIRQQGVVLIVCLVLLFVVTGLGLATMRNTGLEFKMVGSMKDRSVAFAAAEQALKVAETWLATTALTEASSYVDGCSGNTCFNSTCENGLCVFYDPGDLYTLADAAPSCAAKLATPAKPRWQWAGVADEPNLWIDNSKHRKLDGSVVNLNPNIEAPKYIVEFMCYVDKDTQDCSTATLADQDQKCAPLFRVTSLATGINNNTKVMLQSTYKKSN